MKVLPNRKVTVTGMAQGKQKEQGSALKGAVAFQEELAQEALVIRRVDRWLGLQEEDDFRLTGLKLRAPIEYSGEYLVIISAYVQGQPMVGFSSGSTIMEALLVCSRRILNGSIKWKDDQYA